MTSADESLGKLARSATVIFAGTLVGQLLGLVAEILIVRSLAPDLFGVVSLAYTIVFALGTIILLGVHDGVTRKLSASASEADREQILQSGYLLVLGSGVLAVVAGYFGRDIVTSFMSVPRLSEFLLFFLPYLLVFPAARVSFATLRSQKRSVAAILSRHLGPRTLGLGILAAALVAGSPIAGAIGYWLAVPAIMLALSVYFVSTRLSVSRLLARRPSVDTTWDLWTFSWPLAMGSIIFLFLRNLDILMIGFFLEPTQVGLYRSIQPLRQVTTFVLSSFTFVFLPVATEYYEAGEYASLDQLYGVSTKWILTVTFPPVLLFALFAPDIIQVLFGRAYVAAAPAMSVLIGGLTIRAITGLNGDMVRAIDRPRIELYSALVGVLGNFVLNIVLIPRFGIVGAAVATVIGYTLYNAMEVVLIHSEVGILPPIVANVKPLVLPLAVAGGLAYAYRGEMGIVGLAVVGVLIAVVQLVSLVATRSVDEADLLLITRIENRVGVDLSPIKSIVERRL